MQRKRLIGRANWAKGLLGVLVVYEGLTCMGKGIAKSLPYGQRLGGGGFWAWRAFIGLCGIVAGLILEVWANLPRMRAAKLHKAGYRALALGLAVVMTTVGIRLPAVSQERAWFALPDKAEVATADDVPSQFPSRSTLTPDEVLRRFESLAASMPKLPYDLASRAEALGPGIEPAFFYVRDQIAYEGYPGVLRGAQGAYLSRAGNAFDRSLLLAELLRQKGVETRFAMCRLPRTRAAELFDRIFEPPPSAVLNASPGASSFQERLKRRAVRDYTAIRKALSDDLPFRASPTRDEVLKEIQDHVWVQAQTDRGWVDLDSSFPEAEPAKPFCTAEPTFEKIPPAAHQTVTIRVIVETLSGGTIKSEKVLEFSHPAVQLIDRQVLLLHAPGTGQGGLPGGVGAGILGKDAWTPLLWADGEFHRGSPISFADQRPPERGQPPAGGFGGMFGPGGPLGGAEQYFVAEWLEFELGFSNGQRETVRRALVDRAGMAWRGTKALDPSKLRPLSRDSESLTAPQAVHNIWFSAGWHNLHAYAEAMLEAAYWAATRDIPDQAINVPFHEIAWPWALQNLALLIYSDQVIVPSLNDSPGRRFYADSPRILIVSSGPAPEEGGANLYSIEYDLRRDHLRGIARDAADDTGVVERQIWFGVLEGALEHETALLHVAALAGDFKKVRSTSSLLAGDSAVALTPGATQPAELRATDPETAARLAQALKRGATLIVPRSVLRSGLAGWWEIDSEGADTRPVLDHLTSWHSAAFKLDPTSVRPQPRVIEGGKSKPTSGRARHEYFRMVAVGIGLVATVSAVFVILFREGVLKLGEHVEELLSVASRTARGPAPSPQGAPEQEEQEEPTEPPRSKRCSDELWDKLYAEMKKVCGQERRCTIQGDNCESATAKVAAGYACTSAREHIQSKCFRPGDPGYEDHMKQIAQAYRALRKCKEVQTAKCK